MDHEDTGQIKTERVWNEIPENMLKMCCKDMITNDTIRKNLREQRLLWTRS